MSGIDVALLVRAWFVSGNKLVLAALLLVLAGCASGTEKEPVSSGVYKVGKPYQVNGIWYYPAEDYNYDETGIASWYGPGFHKENTANGEVFDQNELSAAHKTLPMPSLVRVTNLDSGRSIVVRVNDRGPFVPGRILDMSRRGAQLLGYEQSGTAKVRVQILAEESRAIAAAAKAGKPIGAVATAATASAATAPAPGAALPAVTPVAAPAGKITSEALPPSPQQGAAPNSAPAAPQPLATAVPGTTVNGRFLPAPVVASQPVTGKRQIFVQAGSFSRYDNASRLKERLASIAPALISQVKVGGAQFYRVRLGPIATVDKADAILDRVVSAGGTDARMVVD